MKYVMGERKNYVPEQIAGAVLAAGVGVALGLWLGLFVVRNYMI